MELPYSLWRWWVICGNTPCLRPVIAVIANSHPACRSLSVKLYHCQSVHDAFSSWNGLTDADRAVFSADINVGVIVKWLAEKRAVATGVETRDAVEKPTMQQPRLAMVMPKGVDKSLSKTMERRMKQCHHSNLQVSSC